jgi:hypothetical protein
MSSSHWVKKLRQPGGQETVINGCGKNISEQAPRSQLPSLAIFRGDTSLGGVHHQAVDAPSGWAVDPGSGQTQVTRSLSQSPRCLRYGLVRMERMAAPCHLIREVEVSLRRSNVVSSVTPGTGRASSQIDQAWVLFTAGWNIAPSIDAAESASPHSCAPAPMRSCLCHAAPRSPGTLSSARHRPASNRCKSWCNCRRNDEQSLWWCMAKVWSVHPKPGCRARGWFLGALQQPLPQVFMPPQVSLDLQPFSPNHLSARSYNSGCPK